MTILRNLKWKTSRVPCGNLVDAVLDVLAVVVVHLVGRVLLENGVFGLAESEVGQDGADVFLVESDQAVLVLLLQLIRRVDLLEDIEQHVAHRPIDPVELFYQSLVVHLHLLRILSQKRVLRKNLVLQDLLIDQLVALDQLRHRVDRFVVLRKTDVIHAQLNLRLRLLDVHQVYQVSPQEEHASEYPQECQSQVNRLVVEVDLRNPEVQYGLFRILL